ncbi:14357_t:CDS:2 [Racocetra fulgida]|uniref:14357_t:CDS:1 n=1 Tax=Racocetra fulgida TaxID=60492 RepID=A0A9N8ZCM5_9GLOM|nr:14357_t:CDS:2 [Racocetra fulgida]
MASRKFLDVLIRDYIGVLELKLRDVKVVLNILVACKELCLQDLFDYMQDYLLNNMTEAMQQNFCLVQRINLDDSILSRSVGTISSICNSPLHGPVFRGILIFNGDFKNDCASYCNFDKATTPYEGPIRKTKDKFSVDELEVFQVIKKKL